MIFDEIVGSIHRLTLPDIEKKLLAGLALTVGTSVKRSAV